MPLKIGRGEVASNITIC